MALALLLFDKNEIKRMVFIEVIVMF